MDTFELAADHFDPRNVHQGDERLPVKFRMDAIKDDAASELAGRPIYRDAEFIQIFKSRNDVIDREVRDTDRQRWPRAYAAWKQTGESEPGAIGTKLDYWPQMTRSQVEEFKYFKIFTVEQLAELPDNQVQKISGAVRLKSLAQLYVESAKGEEPFLRMHAELQKRDGEIAFLKKEVERLAGLVEHAMKVPVAA